MLVGPSNLGNTIYVRSGACQSDEKTTNPSFGCFLCSSESAWASTQLEMVNLRVFALGMLVLSRSCQFVTCGQSVDQFRRPGGRFSQSDRFKVRFLPRLDFFL